MNIHSIPDQKNPVQIIFRRTLSLSLSPCPSLSPYAALSKEFFCPVSIPLCQSQRLARHRTLFYVEAFTPWKPYISGLVFGVRVCFHPRKCRDATLKDRDGSSARTPGGGGRWTCRIRVRLGLRWQSLLRLKCLLIIRFPPFSSSFLFRPSLQSVASYRRIPFQSDARILLKNPR